MTIKESILNNNKNYYLVTFEGPAGSGKTYHSERFTKWLEKTLDMKVVYLRNPFRRSALGKLTHDLMVGDRFSTPEQYALISLLNRNLLQKCMSDYLKAIKDTRIFVVDRWNVSFWTHQVLASDMIKTNPVFASWLVQYPDEYVPDVQFYLDVDEEELENRLKTRNPKEKLNRYETIEYGEKVRRAYKEFMNNSDDYIKINVAKEEEKGDVFKKIVEAYTNFVENNERKL